jgi:hypothetical protein
MSQLARGQMGKTSLTLTLTRTCTLTLTLILTRSLALTRTLTLCIYSVLHRHRFIASLICPDRKIGLLMQQCICYIL